MKCLALITVTHNHCSSRWRRDRRSASNRSLFEWSARASAIRSRSSTLALLSSSTGKTSGMQEATARQAWITNPLVYAGEIHRILSRIQHSSLENRTEHPTNTSEERDVRHEHHQRADGRDCRNRTEDQSSGWWEFPALFPRYALSFVWPATTAACLSSAKREKHLLLLSRS